jgi:hypothetical protein
MQDSYIPLQHMISVVERYIMVRKRIVVSIEPPKTDKEVQLLGIAYDIATSHMGQSYTYHFS